MPTSPLGLQCYALYVAWAGIGLVVGLLLSFRGVRSAIWLFVAYVWFRRDPVDFLLWLGFGMVVALAWEFFKAAADEARP